MSITSTYTKPAIEYIDANWSHSKKPLKRLGARIVNILSVPTYAITCALDIILGLAIGLWSFCTLGMHKAAVNKAIVFLCSSEDLIAGPFSQFIKIFHPTHEFEVEASPLGDEWLYNTIAETVIDLAESKKFFKKNISARLGFALVAISHVVISIAEGILAMVAVSFSILTLTQMEFINKFAYNCLKAPGVIVNFYVAAICFVNPSAM